MSNKSVDKNEHYRAINLVKLSMKLKKYYIRMSGAIISGVLHHLFSIAISVLCAYIVGLALEGDLLEYARPLIIALSLSICMRVIMYFMEMWLAHDVAFKVLADFRIMLYKAIEHVSPALLLNMRLGQLTATLMSDVELLEWFFAHSFGSVIVAIIVPSILLCFLGYLYWLLPLVMLPFLAILISIPFIMNKRADKQGKQVREDLGEASAVTVEGIQGMKEILTLNYLNKYRLKNQKYMGKMYQSQLEYGKRFGTEGALILFVVGLSMLSVIAISTVLVYNGQLDFAWYPVVVMLAGMTFNPVVEICNTARNFGLIFAAANRVFMVLEAKPTVEDTGDNRPSDNTDVSFQNVSFRYRDNLEYAVEDINFKIQEGETVALVGASGAGKSTCVNLLLRYWDVNAGNITIGGTDIRKIPLDNLHKLVSVVLQDVYLFHTSIRENIRFGNPDATDEQVEVAAKAALAHDFIVSMPEGYDTKAGERGAQLSGGQRQRIAIARAILKKSPILILDEAVSNLDSENEKEIQIALKQTCNNCVTMVVAHRLSTIMSADRLVVMNDGKVIQTGRHEELIQVDGYYKELICGKLEFEEKLKWDKRKKR